MRTTLILIPLLFSASPALAQSGPPAADIAQVQRVLADPATADRLTGMMQALSKAFLDMPVGEIKAAAEGRQPTPAERHMTIRDIGRKDDPNFDRNFQRQIAQSGPMVRQSMKALSEALPPMMQGLQQASKALDRAMANMPDPTYPKR
jgi:hypothetical protein